MADEQAPVVTEPAPKAAPKSKAKDTDNSKVTKLSSTLTLVQS